MAWKAPSKHKFGQYLGRPLDFVALLEIALPFDANPTMTHRFGPSIQRFLHNMAANGVGQVIIIASQIFSVPLFLHYWTKEQYGEWLVITSIPSLLWSLDSGLSGLAGSRMTVATGSGDWGLANTIFQNVLLIQTVLSALIVAGAAGLVLCLDLHSAFGFSELSRSQAGDILMIMIGYMLFGFYLGLLRAAYRASLLEARGVTLGNLWRLSDLIVIVLVLPFHGGAVILAEGMLASVALWTCLGYLDVRHRCPEVKIAFGRISGRQARVMLIDGLPMLAGQAATAFFLQGYPLLVNRLLGPAAVVTLTTIRTVSRVLIQLVQMVGGSSSSELSRTYGKKDWEGYLRLLKILAAVTVWGGLGAVVGMTLFGPWVLARWTSNKVMVDHQLLFLFALSMICQGGWTTCSSVMISTNVHHLFNYLYFFATLAGLLCVTVAIHLLGFTGVPLVMLGVDLFLLIAAFLLCQKKLAFVPLGSLICIFSPVFYAQKISVLLKRLAS